MYLWSWGEIDVIYTIVFLRFDIINLAFNLNTEIIVVQLTDLFCLRDDTEWAGS